MKLSELPPELLLEIFFALDAPSFLMCLQTCKKFRQIALQSPSLLKRQIYRIPGPFIPGLLRDKPADVLMKQFGVGATEHLMNGAQWMADAHLWRGSRMADRKNSLIHECVSTNFQGLVLLEVLEEEAVINVYCIQPDEDDKYSPELAHVISLNFLPQYFNIEPQSIHEFKFEIVKLTVFERKGDHLPRVAILYSVRSAVKATDHVSMKIFIVRLDEDFGPIVINSYDVRHRENEVAVAMTAAVTGPSIVFRDPTDIFEVSEYPFIEHQFWAAHKLVSYQNRGKHPDPRTEEQTYSMSLDLRVKNERVTGITLNDDGDCHLYSSTFPIPQWTIRNSEVNSNSNGHIARRDMSLPDCVDPFIKPTLGRVLDHFHHHDVEVPTLNGGRPTCVNTALELMFSRESSPSGYKPNRTGAFLLKAIEFPSQCNTFRPDHDYRDLHHIFVAKLSGLPDLHNLSSLGLRLAVSRRSRRIAMASWKTVIIWSLDPAAFLDPSYDLQMRVLGDYAFFELCGWGFYHCYKIEGDYVVLEGIELANPGGVVYHLAFRGENELWGWTEKGLVKWNFGSQACGRRNTSVLGQSVGIKEDAASKKSRDKPGKIRREN